MIHPSSKFISSIFLYIALSLPAHAAEMTLDYIGQQVIPHDWAYKDTVVGGLSSLDYIAETDSYVAISDDRSESNPARFYELKLDFEASGFKAWHLSDMHFMKQPDGSMFPKPELFGQKSSVDPEALRLSPAGNSYFWASEGHAKKGVNPIIREMTLSGDYIRDFTVPQKYMVAEDKGIRNNLAFEAMAVSSDQKSIMVSTEGPLLQDGAEATVKHGAPLRLLQLDIASGQPRHEYIYEVSPVHAETLPIGNFSVSGVVDILALSTDRYIVVERSFSFGAGLSVKLFLADLSEATDVLNFDGLKERSYQPVQKILLADIGKFGIEVDNIEGISFGKTLKDGRRSLILISDNNFRSTQVTQILVFAVNGLPAR
ncbi:MAG: esterase-like activity of phytase family protein [Emcibacter sp.]|nr:esterase-like activity of phytase family protein [Emcibacter sp.]